MCCEDMGRELIWGDVSKDGIAGVWNGPIRQDAVRRLYSGKRTPKSFLCGRCEMALGPAGLVKAVAQAAWRKISTKK